MDYRKDNFKQTARFINSCEKAKKKGYILNWSNPKRHVDDDLLRFIFRIKLRIDIPMPEFHAPLTIEELAFALDKMGLLEETS